MHGTLPVVYSLFGNYEGQVEEIRKVGAGFSCQEYARSDAGRPCHCNGPVWIFINQVQVIRFTHKSGFMHLGSLSFLQVISSVLSD